MALELCLLCVCIFGASGFAQGVLYSQDPSGNLISRGPSTISPPLILRQPTAHIVAPGDLGRFSVVVADAASLTYQWRFNGVGISGRTNDTLLLTNVTAANEGSYTVVVTNPSGSITSAPAMLYWDSDGDGLPDSWEIANFGSITNQSGSGDFDHDGVSNLKEFTEGTSPTNSASFNPHLTVNALQCFVIVSPDLPYYTTGQSLTLSVIPYPGLSFIGWSGDLLSTNNPATLSMTSNRTVTAICGLPLAESLDTTKLAWITGGNIGAYGQSRYTHDGVDAVESGPITTNQQSWVETTVVMTDEGTVSFWWRVQGDTFTFSTNGALDLQIASEYDWELRTAWLPAGTNTLRWTYSKSPYSSYAFGNDSAWLDQVVVTVYTNPLLDSDGDGLPDLWEYKYFGTLAFSGSDDYDGDGVSNLNEYLDGTNPADASSLYPRLTVVAFGGTVAKSPDLPKYSPGQTVTLTATPDPGLFFVGWGDDLTGTNTPQALVMNRSKKVSAVFGLPLAEALDTTNLAWTVGGDIGWFGQTNVTHDGVDAAQSGPITNSQISWMQTTVTGPVNVSYWCKVSSYHHVDYLSFYIGGVRQTNISGEIDWQPQSFVAGPGPQTLNWQYAKGYFGSAGQDSAWVDQVSLSVVPTIPLAESVDTTNLTWNTGGNAGWFGQASVTHDGIDAAESWSIGDSQESWMQTTVMGPGTLSFWWKVSSEPNYDDLEFYVNGILRTNISGEVDWQQLSFNCSPGTNVLRWRYAKDYYNSAGQDRGWVDQVTFLATPTVPLPEALDTTNLTWSTGGDAGWYGQTNVTHDGTDAAQSWTIANYQQSWIETTVSGPGNLSFYWKVSSQTNSDYLEFYVNGVLRMNVSGEVDWRQRSFPLPPGTNTVRWRYVKDVFGSAGQDAAWVDQVSFVPSGGTPAGITAQPTNQTVIAGSNVTFSVLASGTGPLSYQWRFNGSAISGATSNTYTLNSAQTNNAGGYDAVVTNSYGSVTSQVATLTVLVPPTITVQPQSQSVTNGANVTFTVFATGSSPLFYQWRKNGTNLATATAADLALNNLQSPDAGNYTVVVTNSAGSATSAVAVLTVTSSPVPPMITSQPQSQTVVAGANVSFGVAATGTAPLAYQWRFNGTNLAGAFSTSLTLTNVQATSAGSYSVVVSNSAGSATSSNAVLTVITNSAQSGFRLIPLRPRTNGLFRMQIIGPAGSNCLIRVSTDLAHWTPLATVTLTNGSVEFVDLASPNYPDRFYSAVLGSVTPSIRHQGPALYPNASNIQITNTFEYVSSLLSLLWRPHLPSGWSLVSVFGDGSPEINLGDIVWTGTLPPSPIHMVYTVQVPPGETGSKQVRSEVEYQFLGMANPATDFAAPDPLVLNAAQPGPVITHQSVASYAAGGSFTVTNSFGYSNTLQSLLWRPHLPAGWTLGSASGDGNPELNFGDIVWTGSLPPSPIQMVYTVQVTSGETGPKQIRGEVEYQFAGMVNPAVVFANPDPLALNGPGAALTISHQSSTQYVAGAVLSVTNSFVYTNTLRSLLWRPHAPTGWTLVSVSGDGSPEMNFGDIVWIASLPPSPIHLIYTIQVPTNETGPKQIRGEVEYQFSGMANPATAFASPNPMNVSSVTVVSNTPPTVSIASPASGATFTAPANILICANASGSDGTVTQMSFYDGPSLLTTVTNASYCLTWSNPGVGAHALTVAATDNGGLSATSSVVSITVLCGYSISPTNRSHGAGAETGSVALTTQTGCTWSATSSDSWITITSASNGTGSASINYAVAANPATSPRIATLTIAGLAFTVSQAGATVSRQVRVVSASAASGSTVRVPIQLLAQGNENALGFGLSYDATLLTFTGTSVGGSASNAFVNVNTSQAASGRVGIAIALPAATTFSPGTQEVVGVTFAVAPVTNATTVSIAFGDLPIVRQVVDASASLLPASYSNGAVTIFAGYEADVVPRPNGKNDGTVTIADWVEIGRFAAGLDIPANGSEFQRADCAPRMLGGTLALGDGAITIADWVEAGRYAAGLDPVTSAGGPTGPPSGSLPPSIGAVGPAPSPDPLTTRTLRAADTSIPRGQTNSLTIQLVAQGDENALGFSLYCESNLLSFVEAHLGRDAPGALLNVNTNQAANGRLGIAFSLPAGQTIKAGTNDVLLVSLAALSGTASASTTINFDDTPIVREVVDTLANPLPALYVSGTITLNVVAPSLNLTRSGSQFIVSWPASATNYVLEAAITLPASNTWTTVGAQPVVDGDQNKVTVPMSNGNKFFRLRGQ
jgi:hypothetical protein